MLHLALCVTAFTGGGPYPSGSYDAAAARAYFTRRPLHVAGRALEIGVKASRFAGALAGDVLFGDGVDGRNAEERGQALTELLVELGPAFIKIGQSASVRTDLLPPAYVRALTSLQEDVPAFSSNEARKIIAAELGESAARSLNLGPEPIAAASLGQVYRGTFEGEPVAVKVQRPAITERIALDMLLVREVAAPIAAVFGAPGDIVGIADAWGTGLVDELDYLAEARNAAAFNEALVGGPLDGRVYAPRVIGAASSGRVLTTEWVDGERLDATAEKADVPRLASLAMNTYMDMMLESGTLHCDPHPGNLLRTADGRLCILDWGLVTALDADLRLTLIEHVSHIVARDYAKIPADLVRLGFVPVGQEEAALSSGVVDLLTKTYSKRAEGGGFANFDVPALFDELQGLAADAGGSIFQIPPYFAYIAKSFATLEGIGLSADPNYSILNETLPYISRRLLTDPSPRTAGALETFVLAESPAGGSDDHAGALGAGRVLDAERVGTLLDGARRYSAAAATIAADGDGAPPSAARIAEQAADALLDLLAEDTPASRLVAEQAVLVAGAAARNAWSDVRARSGQIQGQDRSLLGALVDPLGLFRRSPLISNGERDRAALAAAEQLGEKLAALAAEGLPAAGNGGGGGGVADAAVDRRELLDALVRKLYERRGDVQRASRLIALEALDQAAKRLARA